VKAFTQEWTTRFEAAIKSAAGRDGRLSRTEARRLGERTDSAGLFSDSAVKLIDSFGTQSASVNKLVDVARVEVERAAKLAAGPDGRLSLADAKKLPIDLRDDFKWLRSSGVEPKQYTDAELKAVVKAEVLAYLDGGRATKLSGPPAVVRGRRPVVENIPHPASNTRAIAYVADGTIYLSRASPVPSPLVGWYKVGKLPPPS
jgi:hypothetical protein